jgi:hypothetical protein
LSITAGLGFSTTFGLGSFEKVTALAIHAQVDCCLSILRSWRIGSLRLR